MDFNSLVQRHVCPRPVKCYVMSNYYSFGVCLIARKTDRAHIGGRRAHGASSSCSRSGAAASAWRAMDARWRPCFFRLHPRLDLLPDHVRSFKPANIGFPCAFSGLRDLLTNVVSAVVHGDFREVLCTCPLFFKQSCCSHAALVPYLEQDRQSVFEPVVLRASMLT